MPLYEDRRNAQNRISVSEACRASVVTGTNAVAARILEAVRSLKRPAVVAFDGWYGIDWAAVIASLRDADTDGTIADCRSMHEAFLDAPARAAYKQKYITDDPAFGYVNDDGRIEELLDGEKVAALKAELAARKGTVVLYGPGAATELLADVTDLVFYFDITRQPVLWKMWDRKLVPFGSDTPDPDYAWKEYYYNDYHMLDHQKEALWDRMDYWVEAIDPENLKLMPAVSYREIIATMLKYPIKEIKIYQPGPWGAYRYRDLFDVPGLECNAWNELAGPELGMIVDLGEGVSCEMPMLNLMQDQVSLLGEHLASAYPRLFPMDVWLDDGYFPEKTPIERTAMPIHNHPSTAYVKRHFNEPLGRYETYYICEAYEGACTIMGYKDDVDLEAWEDKCRASENLTPIEDWKDYMEIWDSNIGDLYLIPPGTAHGHGGNQMVLEMDTCPSISATEYSFFEYDFARNSWDDEKKTMTAKPCRMQLEHGFDNEKWRRGSWVKDHLLAKPRVTEWTKDYKHDRYTSLPEMPFDIDRYHYYTKAEGDTEHEFAHIVTITIGKGAKIVSRTDPSLSCDLELFQSAVIPASFGAYEIISPDGGFSEAVVLRWKKQ